MTAKSHRAMGLGYRCHRQLPAPCRRTQLNGTDRARVSLTGEISKVSLCVDVVLLVLRVLLRPPGTTLLYHTGTMKLPTGFDGPFLA